MDVRMPVLLVIAGAAVVTLVPRVVPLVLLSRITLPEGVVRWLGYVPVAVLAALLAQSVVLPGGQIALPPQNLEILAIIPAILVAVRTRSLIGTVVAGVASMALLRLLLS